MSVGSFMAQCEEHNEKRAWRLSPGPLRCATCYLFLRTMGVVPSTGAAPPSTGAEPSTTGAPPSTGAAPPSTGAAPPSTGGARRDITGGGIYLNEVRVEDVNRRVSAADLIDGKVLLLRKGKKSYCIVRVSG